MQAFLRLTKPNCFQLDTPKNTMKLLTTVVLLVYAPFIILAGFAAVVMATTGATVSQILRTWRKT